MRLLNYVYTTSTTQKPWEYQTWCPTTKNSLQVHLIKFLAVESQWTTHRNECEFMSVDYWVQALMCVNKIVCSFRKRKWICFYFSFFSFCNICSIYALFCSYVWKRNRLCSIWNFVEDVLFVVIVMKAEGLTW
jgi:hypothetical protein